MRVAAAAAALLVLAGCGGGDDPAVSEEVREDAPPAAEPADTDEVAHRLASIDAGRELPEDDPSISAYATVLDELEEQCSNERSMLGDMAVTSQQMIEAAAEREVPISVILDSVNASIPTATEEAECTDYFAGYTTAESG